MTPEQRLTIRMLLRGVPEYEAGMTTATGSTSEFGAATKRTGESMAFTTKKTWLQNQALFTARRYAFYATLAITALAFEAVKLGASYLNAMQTSQVALQPVITNTRTLNKELDTLFRIAALSPFLFKDTVVAFRQMYLAFKPLGLSLGFTNQTIQMIVNALSAVGRTTPQAFNRVSVALQHMAFLGRPTGQTILQLARDGLPIYEALRNELHLTASQMRNISASGITAQQVIRALNKLVATTPGFMNAALRQSNKTLLGSFREFKDIVSRAMGQSEQGAFGGLTGIFKRVNESLAPFLTRQHPVGIYDVVKAFDTALTPRTHALISIFELLDGVVSGVRFQFMLLGRTVQFLLWPLGLFNRGSGTQEFIMRQLGRLLSILVVAWIAYRVRLLAAAVATELMAIRTWALTVATVAYTLALTLEAWWGVRAQIAQLLLFKASSAVLIVTRLLNIAVRLLVVGMLRLVVVVVRAAAAFLALDLATLGWIGLAIGIIALLVILYFKWDAFRDVVDATWHSLALYAPIIAVTFGPMITMLLLAIRYWNELGRAISRTKSYLSKPSNLFKIVDLALGELPRHAAGGTMSRGGAAVVGERGPEIAVFPGGTQIIPNHQLMGIGGIRITVVPQDIYMDSTKFATVMATVVTDKEARA